MKNALIILLSTTVFIGNSAGFPSNPVGYNVEGQERCEQMCFRCIDNGGDPDKCSGNLFFQICCRGNGGHTNGCGCREGL